MKGKPFYGAAVNQMSALAARDTRLAFSLQIDPLDQCVGFAEQLEWWSRTGSNRRPPECKSGALPAELRPLTNFRICRARYALGILTSNRSTGSICRRCRTVRMVGPGGLEPPTPRLSSVCSNQLSYRPSHDTISATCVAKTSMKKEKRRQRQTLRPKPHLRRDGPVIF